MNWRPRGPYTVTADPTLWAYPDLDTIPEDQRPPVVMANDYRLDIDTDETWQIRVGPAYQADVVRAALGQGDNLNIALDRGRCAETRQRLAERRWVPPQRDVAVARTLVEDGVEAAVRRARRTALYWDTRLCHGLLNWEWAQRHRGADRFLADLRALAECVHHRSELVRA
ncbi:hypothetical protein ACFW53_20560 [Nocardiopsis dassonvillei]|uniref:hypothetical protein n=1 Tax=Nocardiopsis dassonvillei TaxID=2014 RepID=UPI00366E408E